MGGGDVRLGESRWPNGSACLGGQWGADVSVVLVGQGLVEHELWDWFGLGGIEGRSLVEEEVSPPRRRSNHRIGSLECPSSRDRRWLNV